MNQDKKYENSKRKGKTRNTQETLADILRGTIHLEDGGKDGMVHIIHVLGLDRVESLRLKLLMGLLHIQTRNVMNDYGKSVE
jgi:hypothetical protein